LSLARFAFDPNNARAQLDGARIHQPFDAANGFRARSGEDGSVM